MLKTLNVRQVRPALWKKPVQGCRIDIYLIDNGGEHAAQSETHVVGASGEGVISLNTAHYTLDNTFKTGDITLLNPCDWPYVA